MPRAFPDTPDSDVIVDDAQLRLVRYGYIGTDPNSTSMPWLNKSSMENAYNNTYTQTRAINSTVSFRFNGTISTPVGVMVVLTSVQGQGWRSTGLSQYSSVFASQDDRILFRGPLLRRVDAQYRRRASGIPRAELQPGLDRVQRHLGSSSRLFLINRVLFLHHSTPFQSSSDSPAFTASAADATPSKASLSSGAIAGYAIAGGVALSLAAALAIVLYRRRKRSGVRVIIEEDSEFPYDEHEDVDANSPAHTVWGGTGGHVSAQGTSMRPLLPAQAVTSLPTSGGAAEGGSALVSTLQTRFQPRPMAVHSPSVSEKLRREMETHRSTHPVSTPIPPDIGVEGTISSARGPLVQRRESRFSEPLSEEAPPAYVP
ncbi:hypothetical protein C8Q76DRAFT_751875 [Earliella scabrosa]|nr:hypothetical protein C8Q76DRAFT_751875 [Earliella scabrosa]